MISGSSGWAFQVAVTFDTRSDRLISHKLIESGLFLKLGTEHGMEHGMERNKEWNGMEYGMAHCMERKSGTDAWNRAGTEILCLEQLHGTEVRNSCRILCLEQMHGTELERKFTQEQTHRTHGTWNGSWYTAQNKIEVLFRRCYAVCDVSVIWRNARSGKQRQVANKRRTRRRGAAHFIRVTRCYFRNTFPTKRRRKYIFESSTCKCQT